ncbi:hypothetical protein KC929_01525 [Patescibacteria group bacterium]|nr:hypothetical protein [Patescibacteria group bacterium]
MKKFSLGALFGAIFIAACGASIVRAGSLTPSAGPAATGYSLDAIYERLATNATATEASHNLNPGSTPGSTFYTLSEIYELIPTIDATTVLGGTSYLGVDGTYDVSNLTNAVVQNGVTWGVGNTGTLTPDGGTATVADLFSGATAHLTDDWSLDTGTLTLACATGTFDGSANLIADTYDGSGDGSNRWCMTSSGNAIASDLLDGQIAWVDGVAITGTLPTQTLSATSETVSAGYYNATTLSAVDGDLAAGNIASGTTIFGIAGTASVATGTATTGQVLAGATFSNSSTSGLTGTMTNVGQQTITPTTSNTAITQGYHDGTGYCAGDADLVAANISSGTTIFGVTGSATLATGTAATGQVLAGATFSNGSGSGLTGTMTNVGTQTITPTTSNTTITQGYHDGSGYCAGDTDLTAGNIRNGVDIFGVTGSFAATVGLPTCTGDVSGDPGEVWAKHQSCSWSSDACEVGTNCTESCGLAGINEVETNTSYQIQCGTTSLSVLAAPCDLCVIE